MMLWQLVELKAKRSLEGEISQHRTNLKHISLKRAKAACGRSSPPNASIFALFVLRMCLRPSGLTGEITLWHFTFPIFCCHTTAASVDLNRFWNPRVCYEVIEKKPLGGIKQSQATHQPLQHFQPLHRVLGSVGFYKIRVLICRGWFNMRGRETGFTSCSSQSEPEGGALGF